MKELNAARYVTFGGTAWSEENHYRDCKVAKKLEDSPFSSSVVRTDVPEPNKDGDYTNETYYRCDGLMVSSKEFQQLKEIGVRDLHVKGIYQEGLTKWAEIGLSLFALSFTAWNAVLLLKVSGLI